MTFVMYGKGVSTAKIKCMHCTLHFTNRNNLVVDLKILNKSIFSNF